MTLITHKLRDIEHFTLQALVCRSRIIEIVYSKLLRKHSSYHISVNHFIQKMMQMMDFW